MIYDAASLGMLEIAADLCVIGSGAGGAMAAMVAAEAGLNVVVLEAGGFFSPDDMTQREDAMLPQLYWDAAGRTTADRNIRIHQGKGVGGSTLHNLNLCKRISKQLLLDWRRDFGLKHLPPEKWALLYSEVEQLLEVAEVSREHWNSHNLILEKGVQTLGWRGGSLSHNRSGCVGSGFCEIGCAFDAKNNAAKVLIPRAIAAKAQVLIHCQAVRVTHENDRVVGVSAVAIDAKSHEPLHKITIRAPRICLAASATATPALLHRSGLARMPGAVGDTLRIHPAVVAAGDFAQPVRAWQGIPQTYECTEMLEFADSPPKSAAHSKRIWIVPAFGHPMGTATMMPGMGSQHRELMQRYEHLAVLTAMLHDTTAGRVRPDGDQTFSVEYVPNAHDRRDLRLGLKASAQLLLAAGARRVIIPLLKPLILRNMSELALIDELKLLPGEIGLTAVHPMGSVPMGDDTQRFAVDSRGQFANMRGLWIADGSLFPTSVGVPPQLSIYAMGLHVGRALVADG